MEKMKCSIVITQTLKKTEYKVEGKPRETFKNCQSEGYIARIKKKLKMNPNCFVFFMR